MNTRLRPSLALRPQRDSLRHKQLPTSRARAAGALSGVLSTEHGCASSSVFKRLPSIGETPLFPVQA